MAIPQLDSQKLETLDGPLSPSEAPPTLIPGTVVPTAAPGATTVGPAAEETQVDGAPQETLVPNAAPLETLVDVGKAPSAAPTGAVETLIYGTPATTPVGLANNVATKAAGVETARQSPAETIVEGDQANYETAAEDPTATPSQSRANNKSSPLRIIPKVLGDYELLAELGKGGMGVVYKARQRRADRIVALKIIRPDRLGSLSESSQAAIIERFRKEAQAAARLQHDNIVTVYEVGEVDGCHYFSMQYVPGDSLSDRLRAGPLDNKQSARLLEPVCRAVHAAHQVGVLHRDIKPQNIMIEAESERPRIADFGLAKLADDKVELTKSGEMMGTPPYMPPEQFGDAANCTAKADIYSLGATLYHSLSGRPPFQAATSIATMRQVLAEDPVNLRQLNAAVDIELETICMKCLEKEPERRFESAQVLADELQRYLKGEPILSRPLSQAQRVKRWCRRNPMIATSLGGVAGSILIALGALAFAFVNSQQAKEKVEKSLDETRIARALSESSFQDALSAVNEFFTRVSEDRLLNEPGAQGLRRELLDLARDYYLRLLVQRTGDDTVQEELAATHYRLGLITEELDSPQASIESYQTARMMLTAQLEKHPKSAVRKKFLSNTLNAMGRAYTRLKQLDKAEGLFKESRRIRQELLVSTDDVDERIEVERLVANTDMNLALIEKQREKLDDAQKLMEGAQANRETALKLNLKNRKLRRDLAKGAYNLANLAIDRDDATLAPQVERLIRQAIARLEALLVEAPDDLEDRHLLSLCYRMLADLDAALVATDATRLAPAKKHYQKAQESLERLVTKNPAVPRYQEELAQLLGNLAQLETEQKNPEAAQKLMERADEILQKLNATRTKEERAKDEP